jgi:DNA-binding NtrC family response regulator
MPAAPPHILVVDRAHGATTALIAFLRAQGMAVSWARDRESALRSLDTARVDGMIAAMRAPGIDGIELLGRARARHPGVCTVLTVSGSGAGRAGEAMREGACDVIPKPVDRKRLLAVLGRGLDQQRAAERLAELEGRRMGSPEDEAFTGRSRAITRVLEQIGHVASTHAAVLVEGEAGTGKGLAARAIHRNSPRREHPFVSVDCHALDERMIESELFGVEPPAPGARPGRLEEAAGGTLFLREVGEVPHAVQIQLLRVIQERAFERVGGTATIRADVRLITAARRDLAAQVRAGQFRDDLFKRLEVARVLVPPLRERREDIPLLIEHFLRELGRAHHRRVRGVTRGVLERLQRHPWPGNVRELRDTLESMVLSAPGGRPLDLADLPQPLRGRGTDADGLEIAVGMTVGEAERLLISATLEHVGHDKPRAAAILGIGLRTLYRKIDAYGIREPRRRRSESSSRATRTGGPAGD